MALERTRLTFDLFITSIEKLVYDFKPDLGKGIVPTESSVLVEGVTAEQCAKYCLEDAKISCQTFETCQTVPITLQGRTCRMFSKTKNAMTKRDAPLCKIYERSGTKTTLLAPERAPTRKARMYVRAPVSLVSSAQLHHFTYGTPSASREAAFLYSEI